MKRSRSVSARPAPALGFDKVWWTLKSASLAISLFQLLDLRPALLGGQAAKEPAASGLDGRRRAKVLAQCGLHFINR